MLARYALGFCLALGFGSLVLAQESTEPPPPKAAPRGAVMTEELPRAGGIVVFGAGQPLGLEIVKALAAANKQVIAVIPEGADAGALEALKVTVATSDPLNADQLKKTFTSMPLRAVVTAFDATGDHPQQGFDAVRNIIDATKATNVPRLVFVSQTGAGDSSGALPWYIRFLRSDAAAQAGAAEEHLRASGLDFTIVRAGWIVDDAPGGAAILEESAPAFTWITPGDLARLVAATVDTKAMTGKTATAVDPERMSLFSVIF
jgi:uncharacterized protein YbjT (DUF2867 family)